MISHATPTFPLTLGEDGRGRQFVKIHAAPVLRVGEVLTVVRTDRSYTSSRRSGRVERYGPTRVIAEGRWAHGDAGAICGGPDLLLAVMPGAAWFSVGGDGVGRWSWVRATGEVVSMTATWRKENPQEAIPFLQELGALPCLPPDKGWRSQLAELEAQFGGAPAPAPEILTQAEKAAADARQLASVSVPAGIGRGFVEAAVAGRAIAGAASALLDAPSQTLTAEEEAVYTAIVGLPHDRRLLLLSTLKERGALSAPRSKGW
jgi:hypothetical protein